jgi:putative colanic acid biosynthesis glycosyltransferase WcaI
MRFLFVNQYFPPDVSASAHHLGELAEDLAESHDVWVVAGRPSYNPSDAVRPPGTVHKVTAWSTTFDRTSMAGRVANYVTFIASSLVRAMQVPRADVIVALTDPPAIGLVGLAAARRHRAPFVYVCQDIFPDVGVALGVIRSFLVVRAWRWVNRLLRARAARVVAIGRDMEAKLVGEGVPPTKVSLLRNWGVGEIPDAEEIDALRKKEGWAGRFVVMHAGNLGLAQNPDVVLRAARLIHPLDPNMLFVFLGDGAARPRLEEVVSREGPGNIHFLHYRPKTEAQMLMGAADVHVVSLMPGLWGCVSPSKVYGILAAGRPFVAAVDAGSETALLAEEHGCGVRVDPDDPSALADALLGLRSAPLGEMGRLGRSAFDRSYSRSVATEAYRLMLEQVGRVDAP